MAEIPAGQMGRREPIAPRNEHHLVSRRNFVKLVAGAVAVGAGKILIDRGFNVGSVLKDAGDRANEEISRRVVELNTRKGDYDMPAPPGRTAEDLSKLPTNIQLEDIPRIPENDILLPKDAFGNPTILGFDGHINKLQTIGQGPDGVLKTVEYPPSADITGYLIAKERQPDGSVLFGIELPYLEGQKDILANNSDTTSPQIRKKVSQVKDLDPNEMITIGGVIVWIKLYKSPNPTYYPLDSDVTWDPKSFSGTNSGYGEKALAQYAQVGDLIRAKIALQADTNSAQVINGLNDFVNLYHYGNNINSVRDIMERDIDNNMRSAQRIVSDAGKSIPLTEQLNGKRYLFTASEASFIPK